MSETTLHVHTARGPLPSALPGGEIVELSEQLLRKSWALGAKLAVAGSLLSGVYLLLAPRPNHTTWLACSWITLLIAILALAIRPEAAFSRVRRRPELAPLAAAAVGGMYLVLGADANALWFTTIVPLSIVGSAVPRRFAVTAAALVAAGQLSALAEPGPSGGATVAGAAVADLVLPIFVVSMMDRLARFLLTLNFAVTQPAKGRLQQDPSAPHGVLGSGRSVGADPESISSVPTRLPMRRPDPARASPLGLTARQLQAAILLAGGLRHAEIAACLGISIRQARRLTTGARERAGVRTKRALIALLVQHGLVDPAVEPRR